MYLSLWLLLYNILRYSICLYSLYFFQTILLIVFIFTLENFHLVKLLTCETNLFRTAPNIRPVFLHRPLTILEVTEYD